MFRLAPTAACLALAGLSSAQTAAPPAGQPAEPGPVRAEWRPVDPTVEDVDPIAASQRRANLGLGAFTPEFRMRTRIDPDAPLGVPPAINPIDPATGLVLPQPYRYEAPGVRARVQRPSYITIVDPSRQDILFGGEGTRRKPFVAVNRQPISDPLYVELLPANTVFELTPDTPPTLDPLPADWVDQRIDGRVGHGNHGTWRIDANVDHAMPARRVEGIADAPTLDGPPAHESIDRTEAPDPDPPSADAEP